MLRPFLLVIFLSQIHTVYVTNPTFADKLDRLYEKVEKFTIGTPKKSNSKLYAKLDRLNSLTLDRNRDLSDDDEELLSAMQIWGSMSDEQLRGLVKEIQQMKDEDKSERLTDGDYDGDWPDDEQDLETDGDYHNDGEEWDPLDDDTGSTSRPIVGVTPSAFTRLDTREPIDYVDPIAATNERPRILDDSNATPKEKMSLRRTAFKNVGEVFRSNDCLVPQPRWLYLRNLAPAADTVYMPPCVKLHRCAPDACCCKDERQECAPIDGKYVAIPVYLGKPNRTLTVARMLFFNHTRCSCIYRDSIESTARTKIDFREERRDEMLARRESVRERQNDWRAPTEEPKLERDEAQTSPPQLRRCTCPALFRNRIKDGICSCVCDWPDTTRKRDCLSLARGKEHFGLRDRVCVAQGDCSLPSCEYGAYERSAGRCPTRRVKRRFHSRRYQDKV
ncbi:uncharacterized protein LOC123869390 [Maniola jurtina]|uniref:uncharacterized protein LOC123869390 n=1 Tax=Maniola jurtina TaxID=191418 RepID=UPI001E6860FB|nr:uncharacterized protein LOC123869390 [Maniola jurtina]